MRNGPSHLPLQDATDDRFVFYEHQHGSMRRMDITGESVLTGAAESIRPRFRDEDWTWHSISVNLPTTPFTTW